MGNYVYIVECADGTWYTGWTTDVGKRVRAHNEGAILLYAQEGFQRVGMRKNYYERPREDALLMTRFLLQEEEKKDEDTCL